MRLIVETRTIQGPEDFKPYTSSLQMSAVSERRSPHYPGGTHARSVAPGSRLGAEPECGGTTPLSGRLEPAGDAHPGSGRRANSRARGHQPSAHSRPQRGGLKPPSPRPPRKRRREMPTSGKPAADGGGGGDTEWKAKWRRQRRPGAEGRARSSRPRVGPRWPAAAPPACVPALPHPEPRATRGSRGRAPAAAAPTLGPAAAVQEPHCPLQVSPEPAPRVGLTLLPSPSRRGGGRRGPRPSPLAGAQGPPWSGGLGRPGPGLTGLFALT